LAFDLIEEFRAAAADRLILWLLNKRILNKEHFHSHATGKGTYLTRTGMQLYFLEYETFMTKPVISAAASDNLSFRRRFRVQAEGLARAIREGTPYQPFLL
jgi:CRISPR/Cas system-associated endonuclease Cas1